VRRDKEGEMGEPSEGGWGGRLVMCCCVGVLVRWCVDVLVAVQHLVFRWCFGVCVVVCVFVCVRVVFVLCLCFGVLMCWGFPRFVHVLVCFCVGFLVRCVGVLACRRFDLLGCCWSASALRMHTYLHFEVRVNPRHHVFHIKPSGLSSSANTHNRIADRQGPAREASECLAPKTQTITLTQTRIRNPCVLNCLHHTTMVLAPDNTLALTSDDDDQVEPPPTRMPTARHTQTHKHTHTTHRRAHTHTHARPRALTAA
jgi:hypothetical protein